MNRRPGDWMPLWVARIVVLGWALATLLLLAPLATGAGSAPSLGPSAGVPPLRVGPLALGSLRMAGLAALLAVAVAIPVAVVARRALGRRGGGWLLVIAALPLFVPPGVVTVAAIRLLGPGGWLEPWLPTVLLPPAELVTGSPTTGWLYTGWGGALVLAWSYGPLATLAAAAALARAGASFEEAARLDASFAAVLARLTMRLAAPGLLVGAALVLLFSLTDFAVPESLRSLPVLVSDVYVRFGVFYDTRGALVSALALVGVAAAALSVVWAAAWMAGWTTDGADSSPDDAPSVSTLARDWRRPLGRAIVVVGVALGVAPAVGLVVVLAGTATGPKGPLPIWADTWATSWPELAMSYVLAAGVAVGCLAAGAGLGAALATLRRPWWGRLVVAAPLVLPGPVLAIGAILWMRAEPGSLPLGLADVLANASRGYIPLVAVLTLRFAAVVALAAEQALRAAPPEWAEAARVEGAGWLGVVWRAAVPAAARPALAGALAAGALCLGEVGASLLLLPPGPTTAGVRVLTLMHYAPAGQVSALCLFIAAPAMAAGLAATLILGKSSK